MNSQYLLQQNSFVPITIIPFLVITLNSLRELLFFDVRFDVTPSSFLSNVECATSSLVESLNLSHKITRWGETYDWTGRHLLMDETVWMHGYVERACYYFSKRCCKKIRFKKIQELYRFWRLRFGGRSSLGKFFWLLVSFFLLFFYQRKWNFVRIRRSFQNFIKIKTGRNETEEHRDISSLLEKK